MRRQNINYDSWLFKRFEIGLWLNSYDEIFSDFDPRPFKLKALSADFLDELKRASFDKESPVSITFLVPRKKRNKADEAIIKKRLKQHFQRHFNISKDDRKAIVKRGGLFIFGGVLLMLLAAYIMFHYGEATFIFAFFVVLLEPGGWFLFWEGFNQVIFESKIRTPEYAFYSKMSTCRMDFKSY